MLKINKLRCLSSIVIALSGISLSTIELTRRRAENSWTQDFEALLSVTVCAALAALSGWLLLVTIASLLRAVPGVIGHLARKFVPAWFVAIMAGGSLALAASAQATTNPDPDGLRLPDRAATVTAAQTATSPTLIVRPGDCLWDLARQETPWLSETELSERVRQWHDDNRDVIGADPNLLLPGQVLRIPPAQDQP